MTKEQLFSNILGLHWKRGWMMMNEHLQKFINQYAPEKDTWVVIKEPGPLNMDLLAYLCS
jgi:hypothetical protein